MLPIMLSLPVIEKTVHCHVERSETLRYLRYAKQELTDELNCCIDTAIALCERVAHPAWSYCVFPVEHRGDVAYLQNSTLSMLTTGSLKPLKSMVACAVLTCTLGLAFDQEARRLKSTEPVMAVVFDAAGSSLTESCANACEEVVHAAAKREGLFAGQRSSPGYGDVPLSFSGEILRALNAEKYLGVWQTESSLLVPAKSITAFVGLFKREEEARNAHRSCADCIMHKDCAYLKAGNPCI